MANQIQFDDFQINQNGYIAFDALSLRDLIIQRLNTNAVFTDQNYEGSNISSVIDIIAYSYHVLLFYLNQTSSESLFSQATLNENINKIVSILNYKPIGVQAPILSFNAIALSALPSGTYTIPRYSYFTVNGTSYSFNNDITFNTPVSGGRLSSLEEQTTLFQGSYNEYPIYSAQGAPFETLTMVVVDTNGNNALIDHFNIDVYVKNNSVLSPKWIKWVSTPSLFLESATAQKYEIRLNENGRYEIKFGNGITGAQLNNGDQIAIYYLLTDGSKGEIGPSILNGNPIFFYNTSQFSQIQTDTTAVGLNLLSLGQAAQITFSNVNASTQFVNAESVDSIRNNARNTFQSQYRLITLPDIQNYIVQNFSNLICSVSAINNLDYLNGHVKYLLQLGANQPTADSRILLNQIKFSSSCNFNNIYVYAVPNYPQTNSLSIRTNYLTTAQKQLIINSLNPYKLITSQIVVNDPVYMSVDLGIQNIGESLNSNISNDTVLHILVDPNTAVNHDTIQQQVNDIFVSYFANNANNLGLLINLSNLSTSILQLNGVVGIKTVRGDISVPGISLLVYNPVYPNSDINIYQQNVQLSYFQFPYLNNQMNFINKVVVLTNE